SNQEGVDAWNKKIRANQKALRDLVASNDYLSRNYKREKVYTPLNTLLKDFRFENF
ncbi:phage minor capsid protein, partial [Streptococcus pyogenes]